MLVLVGSVKMSDRIIREMMGCKYDYFENFNYAVVFYGKLGLIITARLKGAIVMPNIKPVSDLRNYTEVLRDIAVGEPVFLTKNGRGRYC